MQSVMFFEKQPFEYRDNKCNPIGFKLIDYLPTTWQKIESGVQEHGVNLHLSPSQELQNIDCDKIVEYTLKKLLETNSHDELSVTPDGKLKLKGGGGMRNMREITFQNLICEFLSLCNKDKRYYTESNFIHVMGINGFNIPHFVYRAFDMFKKEEVSTTCFMHSNLYNVADILSDIKESPIVFARHYKCQNDIEYYIAVILEIIRQGKFIKQCEHCDHWFVTEKKTDEKYCKRISPYNEGKTCAQVMRKLKESQRIKNNPLVQAKERARNRANSRETYHPGAVAEYKSMVSEWDILYKSGRISEDEYIAKLTTCMKSEKRGRKL